MPIAELGNMEQLHCKGFTAYPKNVSNNIRYWKLSKRYCKYIDKIICTDKVKGFKILVFREEFTNKIRNKM